MGLLCSSCIVGREPWNIVGFYYYCGLAYGLRFFFRATVAEVEKKIPINKSGYCLVGQSDRVERGTVSAHVLHRLPYRRYPKPK